MLSQTAEYALRAMVFLGDQSAAVTTAAIAEATLVPVGYLAKVMQQLHRAGFVHAQRGPHGGFSLIKSADQVTVLEVVNAVDPMQRFESCPLGLHGIHLCPLHRKLDDAAQAVERAFGDTTIADLLNVPRQRRPLCRFPARPAPDHGDSNKSRS
ncbi:MAG: Rrf2 family transcriptional regulator [Pirellulales bacterium]